MTLAARLIVNATLLRCMASGEARMTRDDLIALADDLTAEAHALDRAAAVRAEIQFQTTRRAA